MPCVGRTTFCWIFARTSSLMRRCRSFGKYCTCASMSCTAVPWMIFSIQKSPGSSASA